MKNILYVVASSLSTIAMTNQPLSSKGLKDFEVDIPSGEVIIEGTSTSNIEIQLKKRKWLNCQLVTSQKNGQYQYEIKKMKSEAECEVELDIKLPKRFNIKIHQGNGATGIRNISGTFDLRKGNGITRLKDLAGKSLLVRQGNGLVNLNSPMLAELSIKMGQGKLTAKLDAKDNLSSSNTKIAMGNGHLDIQIPKEIPVKLDVTQGVGAKSIEVPSAPKSAHTFDISTGMGYTRVRNRDHKKPNDKPTNNPESPILTPSQA